MNRNDQHADKASDDEFLAAARNAVSITDPVPPDVTELAKIAFQFRDVATIEIGDEQLALVGVRSESQPVHLQASVGETTVLWTVDHEELTGVLHGDQDTTLQLQSLDNQVDLVVDPETGSFSVLAPEGPYRILVFDGDSQWASPWTLA